MVSAQAQYQTRIYNPNIRTLRMRYLSDALEPSGEVIRPYLVLKDGVVDGTEAENAIEISFDELSHDAKQYTYRVLHCDRNWQESSINSYEYIAGFTTNDIINYERSNNTQQAYTHYWLEFPNADMQLTISGNYVLQVYEDGDHEQIVAQVCFQVVEPIAGLNINLRHNTDIELSGRYQQLDIDIQTNNLGVRDAQDVCLVVSQNGRLDNRVLVDKPTFVEPNRLRYTNQKALIFEGGNEFRRFDAYSTYYAGYHVDRVMYNQGEYHALLNIDEVRGTKNRNAGREGLPYVTERDANGQWLVNCEKTDYVDTEAEYMWVHFVLPVQEPVMDGQVYIGGDVAYNQYAAENMMWYDAENGCYRTALYLKQGGYNYMYYVKGKNGVSSLPLEGSHWQTDNEYCIMVYYHPFGERYDRLVGYQVL